jgi:hypothetical protein
LPNSPKPRADLQLCLFRISRFGGATNHTSLEPLLATPFDYVGSKSTERR